MAPMSQEAMIELLQSVVEKQSAQIQDQNETIRELRELVTQLRGTIANLEETVREFQRKLFGRSSEVFPGEESLPEEQEAEEEENGVSHKKTTTVASHERKCRVSRKDLYKDIPIVDVKVDVKEGKRFCPDCNTPMQHLGYKYVREEFRIIPAKVLRIHYYKETLYCPACRQEDDSCIVSAEVPAALIKHSPASPSLVADIIYQKYMMYSPLYRQQTDWNYRGIPLSRATMARWCIHCTMEYLVPVYECLHRHLIQAHYLHADEAPCQVLKEKGKKATSRSYMWIYLTAKTELHQIVLYEYQPGRKGEYPKEFLKGFSGYLHCDGFSGYNKVESVILVCCLAHARRKFFEAIPAGKRKNLTLLDIDSEKEIQVTEDVSVLVEQKKLPAEVCFAYCNKLFFLERQYKDMDPEERRSKRQETELPVWQEFWDYLDSFEAREGSNLEGAVNYAKNHKSSLMAYLEDGNCACSNNAAERRAKSYVQGRKNFLFHDTVDGAVSSAVAYSLVETAKANNLNIYQYLYTLLLYMPDYKDSPAGIEALMPWSDFIKERCTGAIGQETELPETRGSIPI